MRTWLKIGIETKNDEAFEEENCEALQFWMQLARMHDSPTEKWNEIN